ncbi:hypothetical protein ATW97_06465 [Oenococcus oeni]|uniref:Uncharacterized protein n=3 Tax=Oenococcus oeni TaxID=1247 RepID=A0NHM0_OENOE|nr:hypothetical protein [Oenococcus oeni]EAV40010.1 hypothetical protein OENOO_32007 [Oenococcus oeni ATCC BAA-1163]KDP19627.1 hypothetical protein EL27_03310 [Oenococcus oeni]KEP88404.1 hypothetical protein X279_00985 [Oenococcus oeni IOEB_0501]KGH61677.1 hypothetical protein X375_07940 [Oenococcus oeni S13]KGH73325.1 hypothetical protein X280_03395 [Oenococcus oeni IOEB_0502]
MTVLTELAGQLIDLQNEAGISRQILTYQEVDKFNREHGLKQLADEVKAMWEEMSDKDRENNSIMIVPDFLQRKSKALELLDQGLSYRTVSYILKVNSSKVFRWNLEHKQVISEEKGVLN